MMKVGDRGTEEQRFWSKVRMTKTGCWHWIGGKCQGYGMFGMAGGKVIAAHRWVFIRLFGPYKKPYEIDHTCRNTACVNPAHMELVLKKINILRGDGPTAINKRKTHCNRGHPLSGENLINHKDGRRECRQCSRDHHLAAYHRREGKGSTRWSQRKELWTR